TSSANAATVIGPSKHTTYRIIATLIPTGRCLTSVDSRSQGLSKFVSIDEESNHEIMHVLRLGEAQRAADEPLDPGPQIDVFALDFLCVLLTPTVSLDVIALVASSCEYYKGHIEHRVAH